MTGPGQRPEGAPGRRTFPGRIAGRRTLPGRIAVLLALLASFGTVRSFAHEVRPAYLEVRELGDGTAAVLWRRPLATGLRSLEPVLPPEWSPLEPPLIETASGGPGGEGILERRRVRLGRPLPGATIRFRGLAEAGIEVLVRVEALDGSVATAIVRARDPAFTLPADGAGRASAYFALGVEHILFGIDHLLFVAALLVLVRGRWTLVKTITAFTIAHSVTLALATLDVVHVPGAPVEASIALSIVFVAAEALRARRGSPTLAARHPWIVAFAFGLLHGLGFAGALAEIGLPREAVPLALLLFNLGVEAGQLVFLGAALSSVAALRTLLLLLRGGRRDSRRPERPRRSWSAALVSYAIGIVATSWFLERLGAILR